MSSPKVLFGFHAVGVRLKTAPQSIIEIYYEATRRDARMRQFLDRAREAGAAHAVIAPKDHAVGINATVAKVASGAAETMPYFMVTNLSRTLNELKERNIWCIGTSDDAPKTIYQVDLKGPVALVLGAEGDGMRQLTRKTCDELVSIPMKGAVESLNVSVASGVCLYEALRQRT